MLKIREDCIFLRTLTQNMIFIEQQIESFQKINGLTIEPLRSHLLNLAQKKKIYLESILNWKCNSSKPTEIPKIKLLMEDYVRFKDNIIQKYKFPDIPLTSQKKELLERKKKCLQEMIRIKKSNKNDSLEILKYKFLTEEFDYFRIIIGLMVQYSELKQMIINSKIVNFSFENKILFDLKKMSLTDLKVSTDFYSLEVSSMNLRNIKQLMDNYKNQPIQHNECSDYQSPSILIQSIIRKFLSRQKSVKRRAIKIIQRFILFRRCYFKWLLVKQELTPKIEKCLFELDWLRKCLQPCEPILTRFIFLNEKKYQLILKIVVAIINNLNLKSELDNCYQLIQERDIVKRKLIKHYQIPLVDPLLSINSLYQKISECKNKIQKLSKSKNKTSLSIARLTLETIRDENLKNTHILLLRYHSLQKEINLKWSDIQEDQISYLKKMIRTLDCLELEDLSLSVESYKRYLTHLDLVNKEKLINEFIQKNLESKTRKKPANRKKKKKKLKIRSAIIIQTFLRRISINHQYNFVRHQVSLIQKNVRKWLVLRNFVCSSKNPHILKKKDLLSLKHQCQKDRLMSLEKEVDEFFRSRYQRELDILLSDKMDTYPGGKRVPFEIQGLCQGIPEGFISKNKL